MFKHINFDLAGQLKKVLYILQQEIIQRNIHVLYIYSCY